MMIDHATALRRLAEDFLQSYRAFYPVIASTQGLHEYDGRITDLSDEAIQAWLDALYVFHLRLVQIDPGQLDLSAGSVQVLDYGLLRWQIELELWRWIEEREHERNPMIYAYNVMVDQYIKRNYAPLEERVKALTSHLRAIPQAMSVASQNLTGSVPQVLVEEALNIFPGLIAFLEEHLPQAIDQEVLSRDALASLWAARDEAVSALNDFIIYMREELLFDAHDDFAIGAKRFADMLRYSELIELPLEQLLAIGEADLARNQAAIAAVAAQLDPSKTVQEHMVELGRNHPPADELLAETRGTLEGLRSFLIERDLVTVPSEVRCLVEETPSFARWAFAMMDTAGPFEQVATESFYYVTLPQADWPPEQIEGWLTKFDYATLVDTSIHEAYPGHYVHFLRIRQAPSALAKSFWSYSHAESWAHYVEQMMLDEGYGNGDLHLRLAQLAEALVRNCRYICAIKMHTEDMSIDEATEFFMQNAYMDKVTAEKEARRGTHDPGYINYTLGKLLLLKFLADYREAFGEEFSLKRFHDDYIGYGSPPIPLLRQLLLPHDNGVL